VEEQSRGMRGIKTHYVIEALLEVEGKIYMQQLTLLVRALLATVV